MARDFAIDLGTANTLVYCPGEGIIFNEPTVIAVHAPSGKVLEMGDRAWQLIDEAPADVVAARPLRTGKITDFDVLERMMKLILQRCRAGRFPRPRVLVTVPATITQVERRAVEAAVKSAGGRAVVLVGEFRRCSRPSPGGQACPVWRRKVSESHRSVRRATRPSRTSNHITPGMSIGVPS